MRRVLDLLRDVEIALDNLAGAILWRLLFLVSAEPASEEVRRAASELQ